MAFCRNEFRLNKYDETTKVLGGYADLFLIASVFAFTLSNPIVGTVCAAASAGLFATVVSRFCQG